MYYVENNQIIFEQKDNNVIRYLREVNNKLLGFKYNNNMYYYMKNPQEDIIGILDSNLNVIVNYEYDSWGKVVSVKDVLGNEITDLSHIGHINPFRYRSYYYDNETGLYYLNSRYYNPIWGRFINVDEGVLMPGELKGYNMYEYSFNNPISFDDSDGSWPKWLKVVAAITVAVVAVAAVVVAVATTGGVASMIAAGVIKGAAVGTVAGAVGGAVGNAISHVVSTGSTKGVKKAIVEGASVGAVIGAASGAVAGGVSSTASVVNAAKNWSQGGTYKSGYDSMVDHYKRQVILKDFEDKNNIVKYTNDALNFANNNKSVLQFTNPSRSTMIPSWTSPYSSANSGGWFTSDGKILTFWYK